MRVAAPLLSTLKIQAVARIRYSLERSMRQAMIIGLAGLLLIAGTAFGLVAAYHALVSIYHFDPAEASAIVAGILLLTGFIVLAFVPTSRKPKRAARTRFFSNDATGIVQQGVQQIGPVPLIAIAFITGILAGRR